MNNYKQKIIDSHTSGETNKYMTERLMNACSYGLTDDIFEQALDDAKYKTKLGIENDEDYSLVFVLANLLEDILEDTFGVEIDDEDKEQMLLFMLKNKEELKDLTGVRVSMYKWLCDCKKCKKVAYPNITGKENREPQYDVDKWTQSVKQLYSIVSSGKVDKESAINFITAKWDEDERFKFKNWLRYYESGNAEKYNVKNANANNINLPDYMLNPETRSNQPMSSYRVKKEKTKKEQDMAEANRIKLKMKSRLRSLRSLLDKYNNILPHHDLEQIQDEMYALDKSLMRLNIKATIEDCVIRTANRIEKLGFKDGADLLISAAQGEEVVESLPDPINSTPDQNKPTVDMGTIINRLEMVSKELKSRNIIRELASIDILLNELGVSSFFPEVASSQSKLIESFGYASSKVEETISKLRGGTLPMGTNNTLQTQQTSPSSTPPSIVPPKVPVSSRKDDIEVEELRDKPIGEIKRSI